MNNTQQIQHALGFIPAHSRETWIKVSMAIKSELGEAGFDLWDSWSQQADNYDGKAARSVWRGIKPAGGIGAGSLFYIAKEHGWQPTERYTPPTPAERMALEQERARRLIKVETEKLERQLAAAHKAQRIWCFAGAADPSHSYLQKKQIKPLGLRQYHGALLVPLSDENGQLINLQFIQPDGQKRFLTGGKTAGAFVAIGEQTDLIYIVEGYATGATIYQLTGKSVFCTLSAGNLMAVACMARKYLPQAHIVIAGDNDHASKVNTGQKAAYEAARAINAEVLLPPFKDGDTGSDWNDFYLMEVSA